MADVIQADYDQLEQVASRFANQSQEVQQVIQNVRGSFDKLEGGGWMGDAAEAFFAEMQDDLFPATQRLQEALDEASLVTKEIADTVKQAEEEASSPFR